MPEAFQNGDHLIPTTRLWPDKETGPWVLVFHWQVLNGRAECIGMDMVSSLPDEEIDRRFGGRSVVSLPAIGTPLRTSTLRSMNLAEILAEERVRANEFWDNRFGDPSMGVPYVAPREMRPATIRRLQRVAEVYREAWREGRPPTKEVAKQLGVTVAAASGLVSRARAAGFLPPTSPGVPSGSPAADEASAAPS